MIRRASQRRFADERGQSLVLTFLVVNAYSAAVVGRLKNLPATFLGAIALGMIVDLTNVQHLWGTGDLWNRMRNAVPALFLFRLGMPSLRRGSLS